MEGDELEGWGAADMPMDDGYDTEGEINKFAKTENKKAKTGGFNRFGLTEPVLQGISRKGYKLPSPIQRKTIPLILEGKDVVAMARTGSGKTAAFLIPMFEKLKSHSSKIGARALIISPTRELAMQTLAFTKELGHCTNLRVATVLGGDSIHSQFAAIHEHPDILIATPGRFMHLCIEMELRLHTVRYVVFDEADRLFEMGFQEQLKDVMKRLASHRQTLLFSATLPKSLVEFTRAGLTDPVLVRLDTDVILSENLRMAFLKVKETDKMPMLMHLLKNVVDERDKTVIFVPTKYHVDYVNAILEECGISATYVYSSLDPAARKIHMGKFRAGLCSALIVTDVAARGVDLPALNNVILMDMPSRSKVFVHRVGRVARFGKSGCAYALVSPEEMGFLLDLHLAINQSIQVCSAAPNEDSEKNVDRLLGCVPQDLVEENVESINKLHLRFTEIMGLHKKCDNAICKYRKTRQLPSKESLRRLKWERWGMEAGVHPIFDNFLEDQRSCGLQPQQGLHQQRQSLLEKLKGVRNKTIFESKYANTLKTDKFKLVSDPTLSTSRFMKVKRELDSTRIEKHYANLSKAKAKIEQREIAVKKVSEERAAMVLSSQEEVSQTFRHIVGGKKEKKKKFTDDRFEVEQETPENEDQFIPYLPSDYLQEKSYSISNFEKGAAAATFDLHGDDDDSLNNRSTAKMKWDRVKKKYIGQDIPKKIKTESGVWMPASCKRNIYTLWKNKMQIEADEAAQDDSQEIETAVSKHKERGDKGIVALNHQRSSNFTPHPLMDGQKFEQARPKKKGALQLRTNESRIKNVKRLSEKRNTKMKHLTNVWSGRKKEVNSQRRSKTKLQ